MAWPERLDFGQVRQFTLDNLYSNFERFSENPGKFMLFHEDSEWVLGYAIPEFQRPIVWDESRMVKFVESAILGMNLGSYTYNSTMNFDHHTRGADGEEIWLYDKWLIDGQQRLTALEKFWNNEFPVFDMYWSEVSEGKRRRFLSTSFSAHETQLMDEDLLRDLYDRMNFGGVEHTPDQRATIKP